MPVRFDGDNFMTKIEIENYLPIEDLDLTKFKDHIDYLIKARQDITDACNQLFIYFKVFESEFKYYFQSKDRFIYLTDVAVDMDAIINTLDAMDFAHKRLITACEYVHKRLIVVYALALKNARIFYNQSYDTTLEQLEVPLQLHDAIMEKLEELENKKDLLV